LDSRYHGYTDLNIELYRTQSRMEIKMSWELKEGDKIKTDSGEIVEVISELGSGGQGAVYKAMYKGKMHALKWYNLSTNAHKKEFKKNLYALVKKGAPHESFAWPLEMTGSRNGTYGYVMELIPKEYREFKEYLNVLVQFKSVEARITAALQIVESFRILHNKGYSYQDINDGNFFINPETGDVKICDNENVAPYGMGFGIQGKSRYMAPEIVMGLKYPDIHTDRFSLAVVLFMLLYMEHPLEGKNTNQTCLIGGIEKQIFGKDACFCMDPKDASNRPQSDVHKNLFLLWDFYPRYIQELFEETFSKQRLTGDKTESRIIEQRWNKDLLRLRQQLIVCDCGDEYFLRSDDIVCESCGNKLRTGMYLQVKENDFALYAGKKLFMSDLRTSCHEMHRVVGVVIENPTNKGEFGLMNCSGEAWRYTRPDGSEAVVPAGGGVGLSPGGELEIEGKIVQIKER